MIENLFNWSALSRFITGGDRKCIRKDQIPEKHVKRIDELIYKELPSWWERKKKEIAK